MRTILPLLIGLVLLSSCAKQYRAIAPEKIPFYLKSNNKCLSYSYKYDMLSVRGNKRYAKKEDKRNIRVVVFELTNLTDSDINYSKDVIPIIRDTEVIPMEPKTVRKEIHQFVPVYLLYSLIFAYTQECPTCDRTNYPIGIPIALGNLFVAYAANENFSNELKKYDLSNVIIKPGETKKGIICFRGIGNEPLRFILKNVKCEDKVFNDKPNNTLGANEATSMLNIENRPTAKNAINKVAIDDLGKLIYLTDDDSDYKAYTNRVQNILGKEIGIISFELVEKKYSNGNLRHTGFRAEHKYGVSEDYKYKVGTWIYYNKDGTIDKMVDYDLREREIKKTEY